MVAAPAVVQEADEAEDRRSSLLRFLDANVGGGPGAAPRPPSPEAPAGAVSTDPPAPAPSSSSIADDVATSLAGLMNGSPTPESPFQSLLGGEGAPLAAEDDGDGEPLRPLAKGPGSKTPQRPAGFVEGDAYVQDDTAASRAVELVPQGGDGRLGRAHSRARGSQRPEKKKPLLCASSEAVVRHRVELKRGWKPGMRVAIKVSGVDLECEIPPGVEAHGEFYVRVNRDRLPPLYSYASSDFDLPLATVFTRDLERLHSLVDASARGAASVRDGEPSEPLRRALTLSRKLLHAPLRDAKDHEEKHQLTFSQRHGKRGGGAAPPSTTTTGDRAARDDDPDDGPRLPPTRKGATGLPPPHYRGAKDEGNADKAATLLDEPPWDDLDDAFCPPSDATAPFSFLPPRRSAAAPEDGENRVERAISRDRRAPDSYVHLLRKEAAALRGEATDVGLPPDQLDRKQLDWRDESDAPRPVGRRQPFSFYETPARRLRDHAPVLEALKALSALADADADADDADDSARREQTIYRAGDDAGDDDKIIFDDELRRALTTLGPRPLTHAMVDDLVAVAKANACDLDARDAAKVAPSAKRRPSRAKAPLAIDCLKLAKTIANDAPCGAPRPPRVHPCCRFRRACRCRKRPAPEQIDIV